MVFRRILWERCVNLCSELAKRNFRCQEFEKRASRTRKRRGLHSPEATERGHTRIFRWVLVDPLQRICGYRRRTIDRRSPQRPQPDRQDGGGDCPTSVMTEPARHSYLFPFTSALSVIVTMTRRIRILTNFSRVILCARQANFLTNRVYSRRTRAVGSK